MSLEEFRNALSTDATKQNEALKKELEDTKVKCAKQEADILELRQAAEKDGQDIRALQNRCAAHTGLALCGWCDMRFRCGALLEAAKKLSNGGML